MIIDKDMNYDEKRRRYSLTAEYVQNELGLDLQAVLYDEFDTNETTQPQRVLKYVSNMVYDYMKMNCANYKYACELIENNVEQHEAFKDALYYQLASFVDAGDLAFDGDGDLSKAISKRTLQAIYPLLIATRPPRMSKSLFNEVFYGDGGGGVY